MWIVQEIAFSPNYPHVMLGFYHIPWDVLPIGLDLLRYLPVSAALQKTGIGDDSFVTKIATARAQYLNMVKNQDDLPNTVAENAIATNLDLMIRSLSSQHEASDPHDCIYALLGLFGDHMLPDSLVPDYDCPINRVFHKYTVFLIKRTGNLDYLATQKRTISNVPSWVPDWRHLQITLLPPRVNSPRATLSDEDEE
jgi:hypothetical protein